MILLHCIGAVRPVWYDMTIIWERLLCKAATVTSYPNRDPFSSAVLDIPEVSHAILSLSKRLRRIAKKLLRDHTIKQFHTEEELRAILGSCPTTYINPKRVQLAFTMDGFMDFFRVALPGIDLWNPRLPPPALCLRVWSNL